MGRNKVGGTNEARPGGERMANRVRETNRNQKKESIGDTPQQAWTPAGAATKIWWFC